jgi:uncharacterized protein (TIGR00369 family)
MTTQSFTDVRNRFAELLGLRLVEWGDGFAVMELEIVPKLFNRSEVLHGGVVSTMLDTVGGYAGLYTETPGHVLKAFTLSLTTTFVGAASSGIIRARGEKVGGGKNVYMSTAKLTNELGETIAIGEGTYRYRGATVDFLREGLDD